MTESENKVKKNQIYIDTSKYIIQKEMICPICEQSFTTPRVRMSKIRFNSTDTDLRPYHEGIDTVAYEPVICVHCGYASVFKIFNKVRYSNKSKLSEFLAKNYKKRKWPEVVDTKTAIQKYLLALKCADVRETDIGEYAYIYIKLAWLFRVYEEGQDYLEKEEFCQRKFLQTAEQALENSLFPIVDWDETIFSYIIGETNRRLKNFDVASEYMLQVITNTKASDKLKDRARDIRDLIKEDTQ